MNEIDYGRGLQDEFDLQRRFNELDLLIQQQVRRNASEDPFKRIKQIAEAQAEFRKQVDAPLAARAKEEK